MLTFEIMASYLGKESDFVLSEYPFKTMRLERSIENDLEKTRINYVFPDDGVDFVSDEYDTVSTIFLYFDESRRFMETVKELNVNTIRSEFRELLGAPVKSGDAVRRPILGEYGPWDLFSFQGCSVHIEYHVGTFVFTKITFMRTDVVP